MRLLVAIAEVTRSVNPLESAVAEWATAVQFSPVKAHQHRHTVQPRGDSQRFWRCRTACTALHGPRARPLAAPGMKADVHGTKHAHAPPRTHGFGRGHMLRRTTAKRNEPSEGLQLSDPSRPRPARSFCCSRPECSMSVPQITLPSHGRCWFRSWLMSMGGLYAICGHV